MVIAATHADMTGDEAKRENTEAMNCPPLLLNDAASLVLSLNSHSS